MTFSAESICVHACDVSVSRHLAEPNITSAFCRRQSVYPPFHNYAETLCLCYCKPCRPVLVRSRVCVAFIVCGEILNFLSFLEEQTLNRT